MDVKLHESYRDTPQAKQAKQIISACVHCGFCNATCPTYQHFSDERDGPRGRISLIKQMLETGNATDKTQIHFDQCLTCRNCETTCPSNVQYGQLIDIGRQLIDEKTTRPLGARFSRKLLILIVPFPKRFGLLLRLGQLCKPLLWGELKRKIPEKQTRTIINQPDCKRKMILLSGCVQSVAKPETNQAATRLLNRFNIAVREHQQVQCCGAVTHHLDFHERTLATIRRNIDIWWHDVEQGAEAIISTASGCGVMLKDYDKLLKDDPAYRDKAQKISALSKDISEVIIAEDWQAIKVNAHQQSIVLHCPCTLQHGQKLDGVIEQIFAKAGIALAPTKDGHLCCGSAGTYSILQPKTAKALRDNKLKALTIANPAQIVTANIGCQMHLQSNTSTPISHWVELLDISISR